MANVNIFEKYGIKEVANVYFEALENEEKNKVYKGDIVLYLDSLKVSTIETTGETTAATGGYGNAKWIQWDYGKEINITLEDALMSFESLRFMLGGAIKSSTDTNATVYVSRTAELVLVAGGAIGTLPVQNGQTIVPKALPNYPIRVLNLTKGWRTQITSDGNTPVELQSGNKIKFKNPAILGTQTSGETVTANEQVGSLDDHIRIFWTEAVNASSSNSAVEITISPDTFPGTYKIVGDTLIRNSNGKDEPFQFVINKAKVQSNVTLTLQAEGDPTTFEMTLNVLRSTNEAGEPEMMKLIRYGTTDGSGTALDDIGSIASV